MRSSIAGFLLVRPAWAHSCGCKSRRELVTTSEVKRNCVRATERGKEAWSVNREPMNKNRIEGVAKQGEWAENHEALVTKARRRRCGGCAMKECDSYLGRSRLVPERATAMPEREVSRGRSSWSCGADEARSQTAKDRSNGRASPSVIGSEGPQMFASAKLARVVNRVKPERPWQRGISSAEP